MFLWLNIWIKLVSFMWINVYLDLVRRFSVEFFLGETIKKMTREENFQRFSRIDPPCLVPTFKVFKGENTWLRNLYFWEVLVGYSKLFIPWFGPQPIKWWGLYRWEQMWEIKL